MMGCSPPAKSLISTGPRSWWSCPPATRARGGQRSGEGIVGLTWALFVAGAPTQVLSQWAVADASTAQLMKSFYANLKAGRAKGDALRRASLVLMKDGQHAHPFYWAPFVFIGDWR